jgi:hypothetical protein
VDEQRIVMVSGGDLSDAELAAITIALQRHRGTRDTVRPRPSRWARAARLEAGGHPPIDRPTHVPR